jgi:hypothetical protein
MKKVNQMGIWMDHSRAFVMGLTNDKIIESIIATEFTHQQKNDNLGKNENLMADKEQHLRSGYYNKLSDTIRNYQEVLLFGPTDAKNELFNLLRADHLFDHIKIEVKNSDKMTANQMHELVKEYFTR